MYKDLWRKDSVWQIRDSRMPARPLRSYYQIDPRTLPFLTSPGPLLPDSPPPSTTCLCCLSALTCFSHLLSSLLPTPSVGTCPVLSLLIVSLPRRCVGQPARKNVRTARPFELRWRTHFHHRKGESHHRGRKQSNSYQILPAVPCLVLVRKEALKTACGLSSFCIWTFPINMLKCI